MNGGVKRGLCAILVGAIFLLSCAGCSQQPVPEGMNKERVLEAGSRVAELLGTGKVEEIYQMLRPDVAKSLTVEDVASLMPDSGEWIGVTGGDVIGQTNEASGESYAMAILICQFEKGKVTISASFDLQMNLIGLRRG